MLTPSANLRLPTVVPLELEKGCFTALEKPALTCHNSAGRTDFHASPTDHRQEDYDSMSQVVIENPVINSPFEEPTRHFRFSDEGITNDLVVLRSADPMRGWCSARSNSDCSDH